MKRLLVTLFSIGWLAQAWLGFRFMVNFLNAEALPLWRGATPTSSFPNLDFSARCGTVAGVWFASWRHSGAGGCIR